MNSKLIAIEGIDGSGKSTLVRYIENKLKKEGHQATRISTREIENESIFQSVIDNYSLDPHSPAYMFFFQLLHTYKADRARRAMEEGKIVVSDRWDLSFFVWHENFGFFSKKSDELRNGVSRLAFGDLKPHLGIYLDITVNKALDRRMFGRGDIIDDIETEKQSYATIVAAYRLLVKRYSWITINANDDFEQVRKTAWKLVQEVVK
ncbi:MAG: dTMP kinase [bacterium]|nr:dTMP kinase [bacterium]